MHLDVTMFLYKFSISDTLSLIRELCYDTCSQLSVKGTEIKPYFIIFEAQSELLGIYGVKVKKCQSFENHSESQVHIFFFLMDKCEFG